MELEGASRVCAVGQKPILKGLVGGFCALLGLAACGPQMPIQKAPHEGSQATSQGLRGGGGESYAADVLSCSNRDSMSKGEKTTLQYVYVVESQDPKLGFVTVQQFSVGSRSPQWAVRLTRTPGEGVFSGRFGDGSADDFIKVELGDSSGTLSINYRNKDTGTISCYLWPGLNSSGESQWQDKGFSSDGGDSQPQGVAESEVKSAQIPAKGTTSNTVVQERQVGEGGTQTTTETSTRTVK
jgi:hypothetical protein